MPEQSDPDEVLHYWFPEDGAGSVDNDNMVILRSGQNPVLAHLFLNHMLDFDTAMANFVALGYQPPQNDIDIPSLVSDGIVPTNLESTIVLPEYFDNGFHLLELPPSVDARWHDVWQQFNAGG
jgi:spermidine/putrescine transport system substrate-binding protein